MKRRTDFVTNSSSSSFICEVCGNMEVGYDMGIDDAEMYECENGHTFCQRHALSKPTSKEEILSLIYSDDALNRDWKGKVIYSDAELEAMHIDELWREVVMRDLYSVPTAICPICQFEKYSDDDVLRYLIKKYNINKDELLKQWKTEFGTYDNFRKWLKS